MYFCAVRHAGGGLGRGSVGGADGNPVGQGTVCRQGYGAGRRAGGGMPVYRGRPGMAETVFREILIPDNTVLKIKL